MDSQKVTNAVTPAHAGVYNLLKLLNPVFRRDDAKYRFWTFYKSINFGNTNKIDYTNRIAGSCILFLAGRPDISFIISVQPLTDNSLQNICKKFF